MTRSVSVCRSLTEVAVVDEMRLLGRHGRPGPPFRRWGPTWSVVQTPPLQVVDGVTVGSWPTISCISPDSCFLGGPGIVTTTDGGKTWLPVTLPPAVGTVQSMACEVLGSCIALANPVLPLAQRFLRHGGSLVLTDDSAPTSSWFGRVGTRATKNPLLRKTIA